MDMSTDVYDEQHRAAERLAEAAAAWREGKGADPRRWAALEDAAGELVTAGLRLQASDPGPDADAAAGRASLAADGPAPGFEQLIVSLRAEISELQQTARERDRLLQRERYLASLVPVADAGRYQNDWATAIEHLVSEGDELQARLDAVRVRHRGNEYGVCVECSGHDGKDCADVCCAVPAPCPTAVDAGATPRPDALGADADGEGAADVVAGVTGA